jgi:hypothetical protein
MAALVAVSRFSDSGLGGLRVRLVQQAAAGAGLDGAKYSGHSLRRGLLTAGADNVTAGVFDPVFGRTVADGEGGAPTFAGRGGGAAAVWRALSDNFAPVTFPLLVTAQNSGRSCWWRIRAPVLCPQKGHFHPT